MVPDGDLSNALSSSSSDPLNDPGSSSLRLIRPRRGCPQPARVSGALVYLADSREPMTALFADGGVGSGNEDKVVFPHGAEVRWEK